MTSYDIALIGPFPEDTSILRENAPSSVYGLARALSLRSDTRIQVIALPIPANAREPLRTKTIDGFEVEYINAPYGYLSSSVLHMRRALKIIKGLKNPIVHIHGSGLFQTLLMMALRLRRIQFLWTMHGLAEIETRRRYLDDPTSMNLLRFMLYYGVERIALRFARQIIVGTSEQKAELPPTKADVFIIPQGLFVEEFRRLEGSQREALMILSHSIIDPSKGHHMTIDAFALVREHHPSARLIIAGASRNAAYLKLLKEKIKEHRLGDSVEILPDLSRKNILALLAKARIFALHSKDESQGMALCEALIAGIPIVSTRVGCIPSIVTEHKDGLSGAVPACR